MWVTFDKLPEFPEGTYPQGLCPFMSARAVMIPASAGPIATPGAQSVNVGLTVIPCFGEKCQLWEKLEGQVGYCTLARAGVELGALTSHLERQAVPPKGETPLQSIAADLRIILTKGVKLIK